MFLTTTNQKGGVGKTTMTLHLAWAAQGLGKRVLVVDLDTQGNASQALSNDPHIRDRATGAECFFSDEPLSEVVACDGIDLLPGTSRLDGIDATLKIEHVLARREALRALPYDVVLFDTPPAIGIRQIAPLLLSDRVIAPIRPDNFSVAGLISLIDTLSKVQTINPELTWHVVPNSVQGASRTQLDLVKGVEDRLPEGSVLDRLSQRQAVSNAVAEGKPVWAYAGADSETKNSWKFFCEGVINNEHA
jgi:chromosome partitioning protein